MNNFKIKLTQSTILPLNQRHELHNLSLKIMFKDKLIFKFIIIQQKFNGVLMKSAGCQYSLPESSSDDKLPENNSEAIESELSICGGPKSIRKSLDLKSTRAESSRIESNQSSEKFDATITKEKNADFETYDKGLENSNPTEIDQNVDPSKTRTIVKNYQGSKTRTIIRAPRNDETHEIKNVREKKKKESPKNVLKPKNRKDHPKKHSSKKIDQIEVGKNRNFTVSCTPDPKILSKNKKKLIKEETPKKSNSRKNEKSRKPEKFKTFGPILPSEGINEDVFCYLDSENFYEDSKECKIEKRKGVKDISYVNSVILNEINREIFKNYQTVIREKVEEPIERVIEKFPGILQQDSIEDEINRKEAEMAEFTQKMTEKLSLLKSRTSQSIKKKPLCSKRLKKLKKFTKISCE